MLKFWSKTQAVVALSSAEAELGAAVKASQEVLGMMSLWKRNHPGTCDGRCKRSIWDHGIIRRMELGKVRDLNTRWLWVQEKEASRETQHRKVKGSENIADLFTKALDHDSVTLDPWEANSRLGGIHFHSPLTTWVQH